MKRDSLRTFSMAAVSLVLCCPSVIQAQNSGAQPASDDSSSAQDQLAAQQQADQMVPVRIQLMHGLDAGKDQPGQLFEAKLTDSAHLKNGRELPRGTVLTGEVTSDNTQQSGVRLAPRFTDAKLKDGQTVPIKATIVAVTPAGDDLSPNGEPAMQGADVWDSHTLQINQANALSGVDLHSRIAGRDSGVFVTTSKDDVKLKASSRMTLAIAEAQNQSAPTGGE